MAGKLLFLMMAPHANPGNLHKDMKGFTIVEVLVSLLLLTLILLGGMAFYFYSDEHSQTAFHRMQATQLAEAKMEAIKNSTTFPSQPLTITNINIDQMLATEKVGVDDGITDDGTKTSDYKYVYVEISWQDPSNSLQQQIRLDSYMVK